MAPVLLLCQAGGVTVTVGFIGSVHSVARLSAAVAELPGVVLRTYPYSDPLQTRDQYARAIAENDAVCFSGTVAHYHRARELDRDIPMIVGRFSEYTLVASLLAATAGTTTFAAQATRTINDLSLDLPNPEVLVTVARDTGIELEARQIYDYRWVYRSRFSRPIDVDEIVRFHVDRSESGAARLAITSVHAVHDKLVERGIPVMIMIDTLRHDLDLVRAAQQRVSIMRLEGALLAVVYLTSSGPTEDAPAASERRSALTSKLGSFATRVQHRLAAWQSSGLDMFYTTRADLDARLPDLLSALGRTDLLPDEAAISLGVGVGRHLYEAEDHALQALRRATAGVRTAAVLVDEESRVQDLLSSVFVAEESRHTSPWLVEIAEQAGMQTRSVLRWLTFLGARDFRPFTAAEWATASRTSPRTAERAVRKLLGIQAVTIVGQEQSLEAGRPRAVYQISPKLEAGARHFLDEPIRSRTESSEH